LERPFQQGPVFQLAERCQVDACGGDGICASNVVDCHVHGVGGTAIATAPNSATSSFGPGTVSNSVGYSVGEYEGIHAPFGTVSNSRGISDGWVGLGARLAINSTGSSTSGYGLTADNAQNCHGSSNSGSRGMWISGTANGCRGNHTNGGVAIEAAIAVACTAENGTISSPQKHLGTP
jgi:hypothetical protein